MLPRVDLPAAYPIWVMRVPASTSRRSTARSRTISALHTLVQSVPTAANAGYYGRGAGMFRARPPGGR